MSRPNARPVAKDGPPSVHQQRPRRHDVFVRQVRAGNLAAELSAIRSLLQRFPYVTIHAEYPGCDDAGRNLLPPGVRQADLSPAQRYALAKIDVDALPVLQLGITLCDAGGRLPVLPGPWGAAEAVWQVGFFHGSHGRHGVSLGAFSAALFTFGVVSAEIWGRVMWVAFGGLYHFGFLLKILSGGMPMPETKEDFSAMLGAYLGLSVFDGRYVAAQLPPLRDSMKGGLPYVVSLLDAPAVAAAEPWQAGQQGLVACQVITRMIGLFFAWSKISRAFSCKLISDMETRHFDCYYWSQVIEITWKGN